MKVIQKVTDKNGKTRTKVFTMNNEPSKTQQQFAEETEINNIIAKYRKQGISEWQLPDPSKGVFADFTQVGDYHSASLQLANANSAFEKLPANLRLHFNNDPHKLLEFMKDPTNYEKGLQLGLFNKREPKPEPILNEPNEPKAPITSKREPKAAPKPKVDEE